MGGEAGREDFTWIKKASPFKLSFDHFLVKGQDLWPLSEGGTLSTPNAVRQQLSNPPFALSISPFFLSVLHFPVLCFTLRRLSHTRCRTLWCLSNHSLTLHRPCLGFSGNGLRGVRGYLRTTTSQNCESVPRRTRIQRSWTFVSLNSRFESNKGEEGLRFAVWDLGFGIWSVGFGASLKWPVGSYALP